METGMVDWCHWISLRGEPRIQFKASLVTVSNSSHSVVLSVGLVVLRVNMILDRERQERRRQNSTWASCRRGRVAVISLTLVILLVIQFCVYRRSPMGEPRTVVPVSLTGECHG